MTRRLFRISVFATVLHVVSPVIPCVFEIAYVHADETAGHDQLPDTSGSVPLWQQGISTWNGNGYETPSMQASSIPLKSSGLTISEPSGNSAPGLSGTGLSISHPEPSLPYTVPIDPSSTPSVQPPSVLAYPEIQLPTFPTSLSSPRQSTVSSGPNSGLSEEIQPTISAVIPTKTVTQIPSFEAPPKETGVDDVQFVGEIETNDRGVVEQVSGYGPTLTDQVNAGVAVVSPPLREEAIRWYQYPWRWMSSGWTNHAEFGLDGSSGNSDTLAIQTGLELKRKTDADTMAIDFDYRFVTSQDNTTEDNGRLNLDYDRLINDTPWSYFGKFGMEWDKFKAFDLRLNLNGGVGYHWIRNDRSTLVSRFGAGASKEIGAPDDDWTPEAVFGFDGEHRINKYHKVKAKVDYFPAWEDFSDFRLVTDMAWEILLDDEDNLSLKLAATDRYDSTPQGAEANDVYYSLLLLVKF